MPANIAGTIDIVEATKVIKIVPMIAFEIPASGIPYGFDEFVRNPHEITPTPFLTISNKIQPIRNSEEQTAKNEKIEKKAFLSFLKNKLLYFKFSILI